MRARACCDIRRPGGSVKTLSTWSFDLGGLSSNLETHIDEYADNCVSKHEQANCHGSHPELFDGKDAIVLCQDAELDHSHGEWIHKLVDVPMLECRDEDLLQR